MIDFTPGNSSRYFLNSSKLSTTTVIYSKMFHSWTAKCVRKHLILFLLSCHLFSFFWCPLALEWDKTAENQPLSILSKVFINLHLFSKDLISFLQTGKLLPSYFLHHNNFCDECTYSRNGLRAICLIMCLQMVTSVNVCWIWTISFDQYTVKHL